MYKDKGKKSFVNAGVQQNIRAVTSVNLAKSHRDEVSRIKRSRGKL